MAESKNTVFDYLYKNEIVEKGFDIKIKKVLSMDEQINFCNCIVKQVFVNSNYTPALFDFAVRFATFIYYTNVEIKGVDSPGISDKLNDALYHGSIFKYITDRVNKEQYEALIEAAREQIRYESSNVAGRLIYWANMLGETFNKKLAGLEFSKNDIEALTSLAERINNISEDKLIHAIANTNKNQ